MTHHKIPASYPKYVTPGLQKFLDELREGGMVRVGGSAESNLIAVRLSHLRALGYEIKVECTRRYTLVGEPKDNGKHSETD